MQLNGTLCVPVHLTSSDAANEGVSNGVSILLFAKKPTEHLVQFPKKNLEVHPKISIWDQKLIENSAKSDFSGPVTHSLHVALPRAVCSCRLKICHQAVKPFGLCPCVFEVHCLTKVRMFSTIGQYGNFNAFSACSRALA